MPGSPPLDHPLRVLLVDDHPLFLEGLRNLLVTEGIQVVGIAQDGLEALAQARRLHPNVILMDIQMPRCDGVCATRLIKAELPECKVVMLTILEDEQDVLEAIKSGASGYLFKSLDATEFFQYLNELQAGHPPFSPGLAEMILKEFNHWSVMPEAQTAYPDSIPAQGDPTQANSSQGLPLTSRQLQILTLIARGQTYGQAAAAIGITERTVKYHMAEILDRLHLQNRAQVIAYAAQKGLVQRKRDRET